MIPCTDERPPRADTIAKDERLIEIGPGVWALSHENTTNPVDGLSNKAPDVPLLGSRREIRQSLLTHIADEQAVRGLESFRRSRSFTVQPPTGRTPVPPSPLAQRPLKRFLAPFSRRVP
jgi:hypothetical protein